MFLFTLQRYYVQIVYANILTKKYTFTAFY